MELITQYLGRNFILLEMVESTNDFAINYLRQFPDFINGTVVWAKQQTNGRGQRGNIWQSESEKSLTFSVLLKTKHFKNDSLFLLNKAVALSIINGLKSFCTEKESSYLKIKWPNDIYYKDQKLGGILIENQWKGALVNSSVIGIGININALNDAPERSISLEEIIVKSINIEFALIAILNELEIILATVDKHSNISDENFDTLLYGRNNNHKFIYKNLEITGKIIRVDNKGNLIIESEKKIIHGNHSELKMIID